MLFSLTSWKSGWIVFSLMDVLYFKPELVQGSPTAFPVKAGWSTWEQVSHYLPPTVNNLPGDNNSWRGRCDAILVRSPWQ